MAQDFAKSFYNSKEWKKARELILIRDSYLCVLCGRPALDVHHKVHLSPDNIGNPMVSLHESNLISLCGNCHKQIHAGEQAGEQSILPIVGFDDNGMPIVL